MKLKQLMFAVSVAGVALSGIAICRGAARSPSTAVSAKLSHEGIFERSNVAADSSCDAARSNSSSADPNSQLVARALDAIGRREDLSQIRSTRFQGTDTTTRTSGAVTLHVERVTVFPSNFYALFQDSKGSSTKVVDTPSANFEASGQTATAIPASLLTDLRLAVKLDPVYISKYRSEFTCGVEGNEMIGKVNAAKLKISTKGAEEFWYVDPANGQLMRTSFTTAASGTAVTDYSDWRSVGGIRVAYKRHSKTSAEMDDVIVEHYDVNPTLDPKLFQSPAHISAAVAGTH